VRYGALDGLFHSGNDRTPPTPPPTLAPSLSMEPRPRGDAQRASSPYPCSNTRRSRRSRSQARNMTAGRAIQVAVSSLCAFSERSGKADDAGVAANNSPMLQATSHCGCPRVVLGVVSGALIRRALVAGLLHRLPHQHRSCSRAGGGLRTRGSIDGSVSSCIRFCSHIQYCLYSVYVADFSTSGRNRLWENLSTAIV
jgi:hypothetical protein